MKRTYKNAIRRSMPNHIPRHKQPRTPRRTIIIHIINRNLRHAKLIKDSLAARRVSIAVAGNALFHVVVVDLGVQHGFDTGFETEFRVVDFSTGFDEFGHAYAEDVDRFCDFPGGHFGACLGWKRAI
jgi:hypothetical protein